MPLYKEFLDENFQTFLWKYDEKDIFDNQLIEEENKDKIKNYPPKKLLEFLMTRAILHEKMPHHKILYNGRQPYLSPNNYEISISHSFPYAVLAFSDKKIGVDIEKISDKLSKLKDKFTNENEQHFIPKNKENQYLSIIWTIKESLYKLHHSKLWSLKKHYEVFPFSDKDFDHIKCAVHHENGTDFYTTKVYFVEDFVLSVVV